MSRRKDIIEEHGVWYYAAEGHEEAALPALRAETWRAMEDALSQGLTRAIGGAAHARPPTPLCDAAARGMHECCPAALWARRHLLAR